MSYDWQQEESSNTNHAKWKPFSKTQHFFLYKIYWNAIIENNLEQKYKRVLFEKVIDETNFYVSKSTTWMMHYDDLILQLNIIRCFETVIF